MKARTKALWIFLGSVAITVGLLLLFIQSKFFAQVLKEVAHKYMPTDFGVQGDFSELAVKLIPPGVVIKNPAVVLKDRNPLNLPGGTRLEAQYIDVTFQFFQLLTGSININAFAIHGATLKLDLDEHFFEKHESEHQKAASILPTKLSWDSFVRFNFRSVSLIDSQVDIRLSMPQNRLPMHVQAFAKELTVGRMIIDQLPSYDLAVDLEKAYFEVGSFKHAMAQFQASAEINERFVNIRNLGFQEGELNFHTNGAIHGNLLAPKTLKTEVSYLLRGPIPAWLDPDLAGRLVHLPKTLAIDGVITLEGSLSADLMNFSRTLETKASVQLENARVGDWYAEKAVVKGAWKVPRAVIESADIDMGEGKVHLGFAEVDTSNLEEPVKISLKLENADFRKLMGSELKSVYPLHMFLNGDVDAELVPGRDFSLKGALDLKVRDFSFDNQKPKIVRPLSVLLAAKDVSLKSRFAIDADGVEFDQTELSMAATKLQAAGKVDGEHGFDIDVHGKVDLADLGKLSAFEIGGRGDLHWTIKGKKSSGVVFGFEAALEDAYYLNLKLGKVKGKVIYDDGRDTLSFENLAASQGRSEFIANGTINVDDTDAVKMTVQVPRGTIHDFSTVFDNFLKKSVPWYPYDLSGQLSGTIAVTGKTAMDQLSVEGDMELLNVEYLHEIFHGVKVHAGYRRGAYVAENMVMRKKNGTIRGNLVFGADKVLKYDWHAESLTTLDLDSLASLGIPYRAPISFDAEGVGNLGNLKSSFHLAFGEGMVKSLQVGRSEFNINTDKGRAHGDMAVFGTKVKGKFDLGWEKGSDSSLDIEARQFDFEPILVGLNPALADDPELDSEVSGVAHLRFRTGELSRLTGKVALESYSLRRKGYTLALAKPVVVDIAEGNYEFNDARLTGEGTSLVASGKASAGVVSYHAEGPLNLGIFEFLVPQLASVRGSAQVSSQVSGPAESPDFKADIAAQNLDIRLRDIEQTFEDAHFKVSWNNALLAVNDIGSKFAGGLVSGRGTIKLYAYKVPDLDFHMELDNPKVKVFPVAYALANGRLALSGSEVPYNVQGSLNIADALITENFSLTEGGRILRSSKFMPQKGTTGSNEVQLFNLDVDIAADRNVFVRNDLVDVEVKGNIKLINTIQAPRVLGQVSILHGRLFFKDNYFTIQSGAIAFKNPAALDPAFDLNGTTEAKGYKVILVANGTVSDYKLEFQSQPPLSQNDIVSLLALGVTSSSYQNIARQDRDAYSRDEMYGLLFSQSGVSKDLEQKLGVRVRVDQSDTIVPENAFRPRASTDTTESVSPKVVIQKEVTKNLNASVGSTVGIGDNSEHNANLEYDFARHWSVMGVYEDSRGSLPGESRTSVGGDVKYKLRFK